MDAQQSWRVASLSPARREDFLAFFDHERGRAFADNPAWAGCYCHYFHAARALDWSALPAAANRTAIGARIEVGEMEGYLARGDDGAVVGWLNAQPRHKLPHCFDRLGIPAPPIDVAPHEAALVTCFVVDPAVRGRGIARALLSHAIDDFTCRGIRVVDAFPNAGAQGDGGHHRGPLQLFASMGFERVGEHGDTIVMRRMLR